MSRGFVRESDQEPAPHVPPRAALPEGLTNYVTPAGLEQLKQELAELEREKADLQLDNEDEQRRALLVLNARLLALNDRIRTAVPVDLTQQPRDEVRFGSTVTVRNATTGHKQVFQIVGVDEANVRQKKVAYFTPIARAVTGKWVGETAELRLGGELRKLEVLTIDY